MHFFGKLGGSCPQLAYGAASVWPTFRATFFSILFLIIYYNGIHIYNGITYKS